MNPYAYTAYKAQGVADFCSPFFGNIISGLEINRIEHEFQIKKILLAMRPRHVLDEHVQISVPTV